MPALQMVLPLLLPSLLLPLLEDILISVNPLPLPLANSMLKVLSRASSWAILPSTSACSRASCVKFGFGPSRRGLGVFDDADFIDDCSVLLLGVINVDRRKKENFGGAEVVGVAALEDELRSMIGVGASTGFSMPMSFIVAFNLSLSRLSSSSSSVSSLRATPRTELPPVAKVKGRRLELSDFLSPPNIEKPFQSKDNERLEAFTVAGVGGDFEDAASALMLSKVVNRSVGDIMGEG
jgi:hypothetical protein